MFAHVVPLLRMPRRFGHFDYGIQNGLNVTAGDVVRVSFRNRSVLGVVVDVAATSQEKRVSYVDGIVAQYFFSRNDIARLDAIAEDFLQSRSSVFDTALAGLSADLGAPRFVTATPRATLKRSVAATLANAADDALAAPHFRILPLVASREEAFAFASILRRRIKGQLLILAPRERDVALLASTVGLGSGVALLHGHTPSRERNAVLRAWQNGTVKTLIGTRQASLIPAHKLDGVLVLDASCDDYFASRRNPRFDARSTATRLAEEHRAPIIFADVLTHLVVNAEKPLAVLPQTEPILVDSTNRAEYSGVSLLTERLKTAMETALQSQKRVLLFFNRKGVAQRVQCKACGHIPLCGTCGNVPTPRMDDLVCDRCAAEMWLPKTCPACESAKIGLAGIGGAKLESDLQKVFPKATIAHIHKGSAHGTGADILLVTEYFFSSVEEPFRKLGLGLVADCAGDLGLGGRDVTSGEHVALRLHRLMALAEREHAELVVQSWLPETLRAMVDGQAFAERERDIRRVYAVPPYGVHVTLGNANADDIPREFVNNFRERDGIFVGAFLLDDFKKAQPILRALPDRITVSVLGM